MSNQVSGGIGRAERMAELYLSGHTLQKIGDQYGMSRERVRQLIRRLGVNGKHGGQSVIAKQKQIKKAAMKDAAAVNRFGCSFSQYVYLRDVVKATYAYRQQKTNAYIRKIPWKFNLWSWWLVWEKSGKWDERGRGQGKYCMARIGDEGDYSPENVFICLFVQNNSERKEKISGLPIGVSKVAVGRYVAFVAQKMIGGKSYRIGTFKTPEQAHKAYLDFGVSQ